LRVGGARRVVDTRINFFTDATTITLEAFLACARVGTRTSGGADSIRVARGRGATINRRAGSAVLAVARLALADMCARAGLFADGVGTTRLAEETVVEFIARSGVIVHLVTRFTSAREGSGTSLGAGSVSRARIGLASVLFNASITITFITFVTCASVCARTSA